LTDEQADEIIEGLLNADIVKGTSSRCIVSWGKFGHLRALFLFWPGNRFGMGFGCPRS